MNRQRSILKGPAILGAASFSLALACLAFPARTATPGPRCPALPIDFQESDLLGTWQSQYGAGIDTLMLHEDGSYEQRYVCEVCNEGAGYSFDNSGSWRLEYRESSVLYLHLQGMRRCDNTDTLCREQVGGGDFPYWDFCEDRIVYMPGEVILVVTGQHERHPPAPRGIWLWHMSPSTAGSFHFELLEE